MDKEAMTQPPRDDEAERADAIVDEWGKRGLVMRDNRLMGLVSYSLAQALRDARERALEQVKQDMRDALGHSNCYCAGCKRLSDVYWTHEERALKGGKCGKGQG